MVIDDFDLIGMASLPSKTDSELLVYPNAVLIFPVTAKAFQAIPRRDGKFTDFSNTIDLVELALSDRPQRGWTTTPRCLRIPAIKYVFRTVAVEGLYHKSTYNGRHYTCQLPGMSE